MGRTFRRCVSPSNFRVALSFCGNELLARRPIAPIGVLEGRRVAVSGLGSTEHVFVSGMAARVGIDTQQAIHRNLSIGVHEAVHAIADGRGDVCLGFALQEDGRSPVHGTPV